jgi:hypothetical protein
MRVKKLPFATLLIFTSLASGRNKSVVDFPGLGPVSIHAVRAKGSVPYVDFVAQDSKQLLRVEPETDKFWQVYDVRDATGPCIYYGVLHVAGLPDPLVFVADRYVYADDCGVTPVLVAVSGGNLQVLTPKLPEFWTRGGAYLRPGSNGQPTGLTVVAERYQNKDVHADGPSKMAIYEYTFDSNAGKFVLIGHKEIPTDDVRVEGKNLSLTIPELGTC